MTSPEIHQPEVLATRRRSLECAGRLPLSAVVLPSAVNGIGISRRLSAISRQFIGCDSRQPIAEGRCN